MSEPIRYGSAVLHQSYPDRTITVIEADNVIGVSPELWEQMEPPHKPDDKTLILDTAGQYLYRLRCEYLGEYGHPVLIFDRQGSETAPSPEEGGGDE
jgi:hypothetical protein